MDRHLVSTPVAMLVTPQTIRKAWLALALASCFTVPHFSSAYAAGNTIKVYTDSLTKVGESELEIYANYADGRKTAGYPGEIPPHHVLHITPEYSFGLAQNWDMGIYLPMTFAPSGSFFLDGVKARVKYITRNGEKENSVFYGAYLEASYLEKQVSKNYGGAEVKGIVGMRRGPWLTAVNLKLERKFTGTGSSSPDFGVAMKALREVAEDVGVGIEHYASLGRLNQNPTWNETSHITYAVAEIEHNHIEYKIGVGHGWTDSSDRNVVKFLLGIPFK